MTSNSARSDPWRLGAGRRAVAGEQWTRPVPIIIGPALVVGGSLALGAARAVSGLLAESHVWRAPRSRRRRRAERRTSPAAGAGRRDRAVSRPRARRRS